MDYKCRLYKSEDIDEIYELMQNYFEPNYVSKRKAIFEYITTQNPYLSGRIPYNIIEYRNKIIGYLGRMPTYFAINGEEKEGFYSNDILIHSDYRGKGIGPILIKSQLDGCKSILAGLWYNTRNHRAFQKAGWTDIGGLHPFTKHLKSDYFLSGRIKNRKIVKILSPIFNVLFKAVDLKIKRKNLEYFEIQNIDLFDEKIDEFIKKTSLNYNIIMSRKSDFLNWKYVNNPFQSYNKYIAKKDNQIQGYMILGIRKKNDLIYGTITDFLVSPDQINAFRTLINQSINYFEKKNVHHISIVTSQPHFENELYKFGFRQSKESLPFMVANWEGLCSRSFITNIKNWYITYGESDYGIWV